MLKTSIVFNQEQVRLIEGFGFRPFSLLLLALLKYIKITLEIFGYAEQVLFMTAVNLCIGDHNSVAQEL